MALDNHFIANGWMLDPENVCKEPNPCICRVDCKLTMALVIEFMPQRVFDIVGAVTLTTLFQLFGAAVGAADAPAYRGHEGGRMSAEKFTGKNQ